MQAPKLQLSNPNIDEAFRTQRGSFFKRIAGMLVLQKLEKALVHSGNITLNIAFVSLRWERGDCIHVMVFLGGVMWLKRQGA